MFADATEVLVAKGKKVVSFAPREAEFDAGACEKAVIGPSGNLRAPTLRLGRRWLVGFHEDAWAERFG